jgi:hypothetical protein
MKRFPWFEILLVLILLAISLYAALSDAQNLSWRWFTRDDAYYYFKVAQNISEGRGSTFDGINRSNGYHPLWMMICIPIFAVARFDVILPLRILLLVLSLFSAATAILFYRLIGKVFHPVIGAFAAIYWAFNYDVLARVYMQGLETGLAVFFVILLVYKLYEFETAWRRGIVTNRQLMALGFIALLTAFSRLDLIFLAGFAGIWIVFRASPLRYFLPLDVTALLISVLLAFLLRLPLRDYYNFKDAALAMLAVSVAVKIPLAYFLGLYQPGILSKASKLATRLVIFVLSGSALTGIAMLILAAIKHFDGFPRIALVYDLLLTAIFFAFTRFSALALRTSPSPAGTLTPLGDLKNNWRRWMTEGAAYYGVIGAGMALYMLFNKVYFGTFSPVSGQIKRWWGSLSGKVYGGPALDPLSFFGLNYQGDSNTWHPLSTHLGSLAESFPQSRLAETWRYPALLAAALLLAGLVLLLNKPKAKTAIVELGILPLFAGAWLQILYYHAPGYSALKEWYWINQSVIIVLAFSLVLGLLFRTVQRFRLARAAAWLVVVWYGVYLLTPFWSLIRTNMTYGEWSPADPNNDIAALLEANTEPGSIIGLTGGGNAGYFIHDRTIINMDGLINSYPYFQLLQAEKAGNYLASEGMDYVLANPLILRQSPYRGQFAVYLEPTETSYGGKLLMRYHAP